MLSDFLPPPACPPIFSQIRTAIEQLYNSVNYLISAVFVILFVGVFTFNGKYFLYTNLNLAPGKAIHRYDEQRWWWYSGFFFKMHIMRKKSQAKLFHTYLCELVFLDHHLRCTLLLIKFKKTQNIRQNLQKREIQLVKKQKLLGPVTTFNKRRKLRISSSAS